MDSEHLDGGCSELQEPVAILPVAVFDCLGFSGQKRTCAVATVTCWGNRRNARIHPDLQWRESRPACEPVGRSRPILWTPRCGNPPLDMLMAQWTWGLMDLRVDASRSPEDDSWCCLSQRPMQPCDAGSVARLH